MSVTISGTDGVSKVAATADKQDTLVSGTNIKTVNSTSLVGSGNVSVGLGEGQTWHNVTASRVLNVTYTNTTGRPIAVSFWFVASTPTLVSLLLNSAVLSWAQARTEGDNRYFVSGVVPAGATYEIHLDFSIVTASAWYELR